MKVIHIVPGSGGTFYCQNCMRDSALVKTLRDRGMDAVMMPMYLPLFTDEFPVLEEDTPIFFGGINAWLQQNIPLFRKTPRWVDRLFDARWILKRAASMEGKTSPGDLGPMTLSMLEGEHGHQRKEVERLVTWLAEHERPEVIHLSNALLIGLAPAIKAALPETAVVCSLQDEDGWLDALKSPYSKRCWAALRNRTRFVDHFVPVSRYYANLMRERLELPEGTLTVVHVGIDLEGRGQADMSWDPPVVGYLSRMTPGLGLDVLVDAFIALKQRPELKTLRLKATGGLVGEDKAFVEAQKRKLAAAGLAGDAAFIEDFSRGHRLEFLRSLSVLCTPIPAGEAFGAFILEALAAGVPVVQPRAGAFPELVEATGGGVVYDGDLPEALAALLLDPERARSLGRQGREAVREHFSMEAMAEKVEVVYSGLTM